MNNSIQGSFEPDLLERCSKGKVNYSNKNFRKHLTSKGGLQSQCKPCRNRNQKEYQLKSREIYITLKKIDGSFFNIDGDGNVDEPIRLVKKTFAYAFSIATFSTIRGKGID